MYYVCTTGIVVVLYNFLPHLLLHNLDRSNNLSRKLNCPPNRPLEHYLMWLVKAHCTPQAVKCHDVATIIVNIIIINNNTHNYNFFVVFSSTAAALCAPGTCSVTTNEEKDPTLVLARCQETHHVVPLIHEHFVDTLRLGYCSIFGASKGKRQIFFFFFFFTGSTIQSVTPTKEDW